MCDCLAGWEGKQERTKGVCGTGSGGSKELQELFPVVMMTMIALLVGLYHTGTGRGGGWRVFSFFF